MTANFLTDLTMGGDITVGANNITMTGNLSSALNPVTHGWFTDLTVTNAIAGSISGNAATVTTNANLTGPITSSGNATSVASQTGTGSKFVMDTSPTIVTPNISQIVAPTTAGVAVAGRTDGSGVAAGNLGQETSSYQPSSAINTLVTAPVTITIASSVVTYSSHGLSTGQSVYFTTSGALPTGLAVNTNYYVIKIDANSFNLATSIDNAFAGTTINTSGSQSGTQTINIGLFLISNTATDLLGIQLPAGIWLVTFWASQFVTGGSTINGSIFGWNTSSATFSPSKGMVYENGLAISSGGTTTQSKSVGPQILRVSGTTTLYGSLRLTWSGGASPVANAFGGLAAIRIG